MPLFAQQGGDWRMPFRNPGRNLEAPEELFRELRKMQAIAPGPDSPGVSFDDQGRLRCDHPEWRAAYDRLLQLRYDPGYISLVIRESASAVDRETAFYGAFYGPKVEHTFNLIHHIPGEPVRRIRVLGYQLAIEFLRIHLASKAEGDLQVWLTTRVGPAGDKGPRPESDLYQLDLTPFLALFEVGNEIDQAQVFWFMKECALIRPSLATSFLGQSEDYLRTRVTSKNDLLRQSALEFLATVDPKQRDIPQGKSEPGQIQAWIDDVVYLRFPPIRHVNAGLTDLYQSEDLDRIIAKGKQLLADGSLGDPFNGTLAKSGPYRGLRLATLPDPLPMLGLKVDFVITAINGEPVGSCAEILEVLTRQLETRREFMLFFVDQGREKARKFRLR